MFHGAQKTNKQILVEQWNIHSKVRFAKGTPTLEQLPEVMGQAFASVLFMENRFEGVCVCGQNGLQL